MKKRPLLRSTFALSGLLGLATLTFAGEAGKVAGRVLDEAGQPLVAANVVVVGMAMGAASDANGYYVILNVPVGTYSVEASMIGYREVSMTDVRVEPDRTARVDFHLSASAIALPGVTVRAEKQMVSKDMVGARYSITAQEMNYLPAEYFAGGLALFSPGVARTESSYHVRGGRATEVDYRIDGVSVVDPLSGEFGIQLSNSVADEVIFMPGGFSAEYGRAMSGVVNLITAYPKSVPSASYRVRSEKLMPYYYNFGYTDQAIQAHLPVTKNLRLFVNAGGTTTDDWDPRLFILLHKQRADYSLYGKAVADLSPTLKFTGSAAMYRSEFDRYQSQWRLRLNDYGSNLRHGNLATASLSWLPEERFLGKIQVSRFYTDKTYGVREPGPVNIWKDFQFRDTSEYGRPVIDENNPWHMTWNRYWYFFTQGTYDNYGHTTSEVWSPKLATTAQVTAHHQLLAGAEADLYDVASDRCVALKSNFPFTDDYEYRPVEMSAYVQDKVEYEDLYADLGLRFDQLRPNATYKESLSIWRSPRKPAAPKSGVSPRLGASFRITDWLFARANYGYYLQFPLFFELYDNTVNPMVYRNVPLRLVGNPDLKPERTHAYEMGFQGEVTKDMLLTANLWHKDVYGLVGTRCVPILPQGYVTYVNIDYAKLTGVDLIVELRWQWFDAKLSYTLSYARGTSSYANEAFDWFIQRGLTVPAVEYTLDFDQRNRFFAQVDATVPEKATGTRWLDAVLDSLGCHLLGYLGNGFPYSPPGGKGDPATWNTYTGPWRSNIDAVLTKPVRLGRVKVDLVAEILNILDIRDVLYVYPMTGSPIDDGARFSYFDFEFARVPSWFGDPFYNPALDENHDGYLSADEGQYVGYNHAVASHKAAIDWINNYGPPRRARLGFTVGF
ncbi:MAG: TonB-dependent receptor [candidate division WOR-3 bacterium]|nr:TonB-dependent receptor [candidate division WOR-3 bacterium]